MSEKHDWKFYDDVIAYYMYKFGTDNIEISCKEVCKILNIKEESMKMKFSNLESLEGKGKLEHVSDRCKVVYNAFENIKEGYFRELVLKILNLNYKDNNTKFN